MNAIAEAASYWNSRFADLDLGAVDWSRVMPRPSLPRFVSQHLESGCRVLDIGCGGGQNAAFLALQGMKVSGVDVSPAAVAIAERRVRFHGGEGQFLSASFEALPFAAESMDAAVCLACLDHGTLAQARGGVEEMHRVLRPGGMVAVTFDAEETGESSLQEARTLEDGTLAYVSGRMKGMLFRRYSEAEIRELFLRFEILELFVDEEGSRVVFAKKPRE